MSDPALAAGRPYAERREPTPGPHDRAAEWLLAHLPRLHDPGRRLRRILAHADRHDAALRDTPDLDPRLADLRLRLRRRLFPPALVGECFAVVREVAWRTLGRRHYDTQLMAGWALLQGRLVEMQTGEGKTFAATLPVAVMALSGAPAHVVTVNDYLARRDAEELTPLYQALGLSVGVVTQGMERPERREAYARSVTYCTNKELAFDYLRDRVAPGGRGSRLHLALGTWGGAGASDLVLRGLHFAVVDEADSVFIDEARTPLILSTSAGAGEEQVPCAQALQVAAALVPVEHHALDPAERSVVLTRPGQARVTALAAGLGGVWTSVRAREEFVTQALTALLLFHRDEHYVVAEGQVQIVDESTGRVMPDRSWERGLHQLIEVKEGLAPTDRRETLARLTYQRLFRRYLRLCGMTGTAREVAGEIRAVYGLDMVRIPLHRPSRRGAPQTRLCPGRTAKWQMVGEAVARVAATGRPVLVGTRSVQASEEVSAVLTARGIAHTLLNAKQDAFEAEVIAAAGQPGRVTVATNMAGRGTDIRLGPGVAERGGLHVVLTEYHDSRRVDRQLFGRCGRQGDPGTCEAIVSLDDDIFRVHAPLATRLAGHSTALSARLHAQLRRRAQLPAERRATAIRMANLKLDGRLDRMLAFSGRGE